MYSLTESQQDYLLNQPESGMGYQLIEVVTDSNRRLKAVAYNAELVLAAIEPNQRELIEAYAKQGISLIAKGSRVRDITVLSREAYSGHMSVVSEARGTYGAKTGPAKDAPVVATKGGEISKRFTAFEKDRRLRPDGSYTPGTYATTEEDARNVHTGKQAVARYALPNPMPAVNVFTIVPVHATPIQYGVVEPAYGQPGGGVEVIFTKGTTAHTVFGPTRIPPE